MYVFPVNIEFEDIDSYGVMHHPKILYFFERTRMHYLLDHNINLSELGIGTLIRNVSIQYKIPVLLAEKINIETKTTCIEKYRFVVDYTVKKSDTKIAIKGMTELCTIDLNTKKLIPIPDYLLELLKALQ